MYASGFATRIAWTVLGNRATGYVARGIMIGVIQYQRVRATMTTCAVSRRYTCSDATTQPIPTANNPKRSTPSGSSAMVGFGRCRCVTPTTITNRPTASRWLISDERKIDTGTISEGNIVFVTRFACSTIDEDER